MFSGAVQPVSLKFKSAIPTKIVITQSGSSHSDFNVGVTVLGLKFSAPCYGILTCWWSAIETERSKEF
jgi:hypothetical protein